MKQLKLNKIKNISGQVNMPGSKSLSNRYLLLAALCQGETRLKNLLFSDDVDRMLEALQALGVPLTYNREDATCTLQGLGGPFQSPAAELFLGNAGTAMRPLCAALCLGQGNYKLTGEPRMYERPIRDLTDSLKTLGAQIEFLQEEGYPPLNIQAQGLKGGKVSIRGDVSSQFLTALLMSAPLCQKEVEIRVEGELISKPYIHITLELMKKFGVDVKNDQFETFTITPQSYRSPGEILVEGDASSASYFMAAAAIGGGPVIIGGVGQDSVQGDTAFADVLEAMGAKVTKGNDWIEVSGGDLKGVDLDLNHIPDAAMTLATTALFAKGTTTIRNVASWRVKETDRLFAMATELRKLGAEVIENSDSISITPPKEILPAAIDTYNDHRMAMCFSLAAFGSSEVIINDPDCTAKTFPGYFEKLFHVAIFD